MAKASGSSTQWIKDAQNISEDLALVTVERPNGELVAYVVRRRAPDLNGQSTSVNGNGHANGNGKGGRSYRYATKRTTKAKTKS